MGILNRKDCYMMHDAEKIALATVAAVALSIAAPTLASDYLANTKSGKFHYADCRTIKQSQCAALCSLQLA